MNFLEALLKTLSSILLAAKDNHVGFAVFVLLALVALAVLFFREAPLLVRVVAGACVFASALLLTTLTLGKVYPTGEMCDYILPNTTLHGVAASAKSNGAGDPNTNIETCRQWCREGKDCVAWVQSVIKGARLDFSVIRSPHASPLPHPPGWRSAAHRAARS